MRSFAKSTPDSLALWNRRLHYYLGLYLLVFLWLFSFTGLLLNHPKWTFAEFWQNRKQSSSTPQIQPPPPASDLVQARDIMRQLGIVGEIEWTRARTDSNRLDFRVSRPGQILEIKTDLQRNRAEIQRIDVNGWGVVRILHTFTGVRMGDSVNQRDWTMTTLWALSMDGLALGMILMVATSLYMWWALKQKRRLGLAVLSLGTLSCALFIVGLRWLT